MKIISLYAGDVGTENAEETPKLTPAQEAMRRRWAQIVCSSAANETSKRLARRLCHSWFKDCQCPYREASEN